MKLLAKIIILIAVFIIGFLFGQGSPRLFNKAINMDNQSQEQKTAEASLMLNFGDGKIKAFNNVQTENNETAFSFLKKICEENDLELKYKDFGGELGAMVESIDGKENNFGDNLFWQYWVNNSYAKIGASNLKISSGDIIEWKFVKGQVQ